MSISSDDDTDSTEESGSKSYYRPDSNVHLCMENDLDTMYSIDLDGDVDMARDGDDEKEEDGDEEDEEEEDEEEEENDNDNDNDNDYDNDNDNEDEDEDEDEDDGKEPQTIGKGEIVTSSAAGVDTMVDDQHQQKNIPFRWNGSVRVDALCQSCQRHPSGGILHGRCQYKASHCISPSDC
jgi:hypothetical protein